MPSPTSGVPTSIECFIFKATTIPFPVWPRPDAPWRRFHLHDESRLMSENAASVTLPIDSRRYLAASVTHSVSRSRKPPNAFLKGAVREGVKMDWLFFVVRARLVTCRCIETGGVKRDGQRAPEAGGVCAHENSYSTLRSVCMGSVAGGLWLYSLIAL